MRQQKTLMYRSLMDSVGEGEGGKIWENGTETCIISQGGLACCDSWGRKESDMTELN